MSTARSSGPAFVGRCHPPPESAVCQSPARSSTSRRADVGPSPGGAWCRAWCRAWCSRGRRVRSVTTSRGSTWCSGPVSSSAVEEGSVGTVTAPMAARANQHSRYGGVVRAVRTTRSPRRTPAARSRSATRPTWPAAPAKDRMPSSVRSQIPPGSRPAAADGSSGIVFGTVPSSQVGQVLERPDDAPVSGIIGHGGRSRGDDQRLVEARERLTRSTAPGWAPLGLVVPRDHVHARGRTGPTAIGFRCGVPRPAVADPLETSWRPTVPSGVWHQRRLRWISGCGR